MGGVVWTLLLRGSRLQVRFVEGGIEGYGRDFANPVARRDKKVHLAPLNLELHMKQ